MSDFGFSDRAFRDFSRFMERMPREFAQASANVLNAHAIGTRKLALRNIKRRMEVRNPRFVQGRVRYKKSKVTSFNSQFSEVGSIADKARFSGWVEQELGRKTEHERTATLASRGGSYKSKMKPKARLKPGRGLRSARGSRMKRVIWRMARQRKRDPFIIQGHRRIPDGLYRFGEGTSPNRDLDMLQEFEERQPRRIPWLSDAKRDYIRRVNIVVVWERATKRVLKNRRFS